MYLKRSSEARHDPNQPLAVMLSAGKMKDNDSAQNQQGGASRQLTISLFMSDVPGPGMGLGSVCTKPCTYVHAHEGPA